MAKKKKSVKRKDSKKKLSHVIEDTTQWCVAIMTGKKMKFKYFLNRDEVRVFSKGKKVAIFKMNYVFKGTSI